MKIENLWIENCKLSREQINVIFGRLEVQYFMKIKISIIVPFYQGNKYMKQLFLSISNVANSTEDLADYEVILVNDSPWVEIEVPETKLKYKVLINERNSGIQQSRINGLNAAIGEWILFLDQDDEIIVDGFKKQIGLTTKTNVVVGNGIYKMGSINRKIYSNLKSMNYLLTLQNFIGIRNLIPSPGECLIKKELIPTIWKEECLCNSGADDWLLWIILLKENIHFEHNEDLVYIHNDTGGSNLSADLDKMRKSCFEMTDILKKHNVIDLNEINVLKESIEFKYEQDTNKTTIMSLINMRKALLRNIIYRVNLSYISLSCKLKGLIGVAND